MKKQNFSEIKQNTVYLGIGSNLGDRKENIIRGFNLLGSILEELETSSLYETEPMYMTQQPKFLNAVFKGQCSLSPQKLLEEINKIEDKLGRNRLKAGFKGPRPLDIDILLYGETVLDTHQLTIPHPGINERLFVLQPLVEINSNLKDPETEEKYSDIMESLEKDGIYCFESCRYIENQTKRGK